VHISLSLETLTGDIDFYVYGDPPDDCPNTWQVPWKRGFTSYLGLTGLYQNATAIAQGGRLYVVLYGYKGFEESRVSLRVKYFYKYHEEGVVETVITTEDEEATIGDSPTSSNTVEESSSVWNIFLEIVGILLSIMAEL